MPLCGDIMPPHHLIDLEPVNFVLVTRKVIILPWMRFIFQGNNIPTFSANFRFFKINFILWSLNLTSVLQPVAYRVHQS